MVVHLVVLKVYSLAGWMAETMVVLSVVKLEQQLVGQSVEYLAGMLVA